MGRSLGLAPENAATMHTLEESLVSDNCLAAPFPPRAGKSQTLLFIAPSDFMCPGLSS